jgi:uncharacterized protein (DUF736 family)
MKGNNMTTIAKLTQQQDGRLVGSLETLVLKVAKLIFKPEQSDNDKAPVYRVFAGPCEIGAGWKRTSENGNQYVTVKLDDPSFVEPIWCALFKSEGSVYVLDWNRRAPGRGKKGDAGPPDA